MGKESTAFITVNVCGIALYTYLFLRIVQKAHYEQRNDADFGDGLAFLTTAFPVLLVFAAITLIWMAVRANQHRKHRDSWGPLLAGGVTIATWTLAVLLLRLVP